MFNSQCPIPVDGYQIELIDDEILIFHPAKQTIFYSNHTGALVWQLCDGQRTVSEIGQLLRATYPESASEIEVDLPNVIQAFIQHGALRWV